MVLKLKSKMCLISFVQFLPRIIFIPDPLTGIFYDILTLVGNLYFLVHFVET